MSGPALPHGPKLSVERLENEMTNSNPVSSSRRMMLSKTLVDDSESEESFPNLTTISKPQIVITLDNLIVKN